MHLWKGLFPPCGSGGLKAALETGVAVSTGRFSASVQVSSQAREILPSDSFS